MSWDSFHAIEAINIIDVDKVASVGPINEAVNYIGNEIEKKILCILNANKTRAQTITNGTTHT